MSGIKPTGAHRINRLTPAAIRNLKPGLHADGGCLHLRVDDSGARRWVLRIVIQGKRRDIGLGSAALVSLKEAREAALQYRKAARAGDDPLAAKRRLQAIPTFEEAARLCIEQREGGWKNDKHKKQWSTTLETYAYPLIGSRQINKIDGTDVLSVLDPIWADKHPTATRVKQRIGVILKWAIARGYRTDNPADAVQEALTRSNKSKVKHMLALDHREVSKAIDKVCASKASTATKLAFQFLVHTACRSGEIRGALWGEIDLERRIWTLPAERTKMDREHRVPLTDAMIAILENAKTLRRKDSDLVFPSATGKPLSDMTLSKLMKELNIAAVPHGFRSTFRDWAGADTQHPHEVIESAMAHKIKNKAEAAYARSDLFDKRKKLMADWSRHITDK